MPLLQLRGEASASAASAGASPYGTRNGRAAPVGTVPFTAKGFKESPEARRWPRSHGRAKSRRKALWQLGFSCDGLGCGAAGRTSEVQEASPPEEPEETETNAVQVKDARTARKAPAMLWCTLLRLLKLWRHSQKWQKQPRTLHRRLLV